jgi:hypothetical protein
MKPDNQINDRQPKQKKSGCGCLPILGVLVLLGAGGAYVYFRFLLGTELTPIEGARVVPQEALVTTFIDTDDRSWSQIERLGTPEAQNLFGDRLRQLPQQMLSEQNIDYDKEVRPWLGNVMLATLPSPKESSFVSSDSSVLIVAGIKDKLKALDFANKLKNRQGQAIEESEYKGIKITSSSQGGERISSAVLDNRLVLSPDRQTVEKAIDTFKGEPSFASKQGANEALEQKLQLQNPLVQIYLTDYAALVDRSLALSPKSSPINDNTLKQLGQVKSVVAGISLEEDGVHFQAIAQLDPESVKRQLSPAKGEILARFPADTLLLISGQGISQAWSDFVDRSREVPELQAWLEQTRESFRQFDLDLDRDILGWLDREFAIGIVPASQGMWSQFGIGGTIVLQTSDRATGETTVAKLERLAQNTPWLSFEQREIDGKKITEVRNFAKQAVMSYGWTDNNSLSIGFGNSFWEGDRSEPLPQSPSFRAIAGKLPSNNLGYFYLNMEKTAPVVNTFPQVENTLSSPEASATIDSIRGIALTATMPNSTTSQLDLIISMRSVISDQ